MKNASLSLADLSNDFTGYGVMTLTIRNYIRLCQ
jgi:hypothetical protein